MNSAMEVMSRDGAILPSEKPFQSPCRRRPQEDHLMSTISMATIDVYQV